MACRPGLTNVGSVNRLNSSACWSVFIANYQQQDSGRPFAVGDVVEWPVVLIDGRRSRWPPELLTHAQVRLSPCDSGTVVDRYTATSAGMRALWRGATPTGSDFEIDGALEVDFLSPPHVYLSGQVERIRLVSQRHQADARGVLMSTWAGWQGKDLQKSPPRFSSLPYEPEYISETGLLVTLRPD